MQMAGGSRRTKQVVTQPIASASGSASPSTNVTPSTSDAEGRPSHPLLPPPDTEPTPPPPPVGTDAVAGPSTS